MATQKINPKQITNPGDNTKVLAGDGTWVAAASGGGGTWGSITGTLSSQTDLQTALDAKAALSGATFTGAISATNLSGTNTGDETTATIKSKLSITTLSGSNTGDQDLSGLQPKTTQLTNLSGATWTAGTQVLTLTAANTVTLKTIGSATGNILDKAAGDSLYQPVGSYAPASGSANYQASSSQLTALAGAAWSAGTQVLTLTAANTVTLKTIGSASGNILDKAAGDALYAPISGSANYAPASGSANYQAANTELSGIVTAATANGLLKRTGAGTWTIDTSTYLTANQTVTLSGDVSGSGTTAITTSIGANKVTRGMLAATTGAALLGATAAGNVSDLTATQATALLNAVVGDSGSGGTKGLVPAPATGDAAAGKFLKADGTWSAPSAGGGMTATVNVYTTTGAFTWTKPTGAKIVEVICIGAGGAGGGGNSGNAANTNSGGGGGGGGRSRNIIDATTLGSTVTGSVGAGGTGSTGIGPDGGDSYFGTSTSAYCYAGGGKGGTNGINGGTGGNGGGGQERGGMGGSSNTVATWVTNAGARGDGFAASGGGTGGFVNSTGSWFPSYAGGGYPAGVSGLQSWLQQTGSSTYQFNNYGGGPAGVAMVASGAGTSGNNGTGFSAGDTRGGQGGSGGGATQGSSLAGKGGNGAFPGGGGGGGGVSNGGTAGSGGNGGNGTVVVITYS